MGQRHSNTSKQKYCFFQSHFRSKPLPSRFHLCHADHALDCSPLGILITPLISASVVALFFYCLASRSQGRPNADCPACLIFLHVCFFVSGQGCYSSIFLLFCFYVWA